MVMGLSLPPIKRRVPYMRNGKEVGKASSDSCFPLCSLEPGASGISRPRFCLNKGFQITQPQGVSRVLSESQGEKGGGGKEEEEKKKKGEEEWEVGGLTDCEKCSDF